AQIELLDVVKVLGDAARRVVNVNVSSDHAHRPRADDRDCADHDFESEPLLERHLDAQENEVGEARGAEVNPAAADDDEEQKKDAAEQKEDRFETAPHRTAALSFARRTVVPFL